MEHEQLALISPALLDKILNHLEGGQKNAKSESTHVPDTNIHQTLLQQDVANMNDALVESPPKIKTYNKSLKQFRERAGIASLSSPNHDQTNNEHVSDNKESNQSESEQPEYTRAVRDDDDDDKYYDDNEEEDESNEETGDLSDYNLSPVVVRPVTESRYTAKSKIMKNFTTEQRKATRQLEDLIKASGGHIKVRSNGEVYINNKLIPGSHINDFYTAIVTNRQTLSLPIGARQFTQTLVDVGMPFSMIKDRRVKKMVKSQKRLTSSPERESKLLRSHRQADARKQWLTKS